MSDRGTKRPREEGSFAERVQLNDTSWIDVFPGAVTSSQELFEEAWVFADTRVQPTPNPFRRDTFLRRKQATFGRPYTFSKQFNNHIADPEHEWPALIQTCLHDARTRSSIPDTLQIVHANWYPDGQAGVSTHADDEGALLAGAPIYSYTFLSDPTCPRRFVVYENGKHKEPYREFLPGDGDLLVMGGEMQMHFQHAVPPSSAKRFQRLQRINVTVRSQCQKS